MTSNSDFTAHDTKKPGESQGVKLRASRTPLRVPPDWEIVAPDMQGAPGPPPDYRLLMTMLKLDHFLKQYNTK